MKAILTYHSIDPSGSPISVDPEAFRRHVRWFASGRVRVLSVDALLDLPADAEAVAITFDDAFENFATDAAPLLLEHELPVTLFVVSDHAGGTNAWGRPAAPDRRVPTLPLLDWAALRTLSAAGVAVGAHSRTHRPFVGLGAATLEDEVRGSAERIASELGTKPVGFAYPYGSVDDAAAAAARAVYAWACTTELRPLDGGDDRHLLPRLDAYYLRDAGALEAWGSPRFRRRLWLRGQARRVRRGVSGAPGGR